MNQTKKIWASLGMSVLLLSGCGCGKKPNMETSACAEPGLNTSMSAMCDSFMALNCDRVFFGFDQHDLNHESMMALDKQAGWLVQNPAAMIMISGYCDKRGTDAYNLALGERRANAVKHYLVSKGVDANRINVISYGKTKVLVEGNNEAAWSQNRVAITEIHQ